MKKARENFLNDVERCYNKENLKVRLSEEIVVLSENTTKKFVYVDIAYSFLLASITLLSLFIVLKNF